MTGLVAASDPSRRFALLFAGTVALRRKEFELYDHSIESGRRLALEGEALKRELRGRVSRCSCIIAVVTPDMQKRELVLYEVERAIVQRKRLVAIYPYGLASAPVPEIIHEHTHAISGFHHENIIRAIEGENIRNRPEYKIAEDEDRARTAAFILGSAGAVTLIASLAARPLIELLNHKLAAQGVRIVQKSPVTGEQVFWSSVGWGLVGAAIGGLCDGKRGAIAGGLLGAGGGALLRVAPTLSFEEAEVGQLVLSTYSRVDKTSGGVDSCC